MKLARNFHYLSTGLHTVVLLVLCCGIANVLMFQGLAASVNITLWDTGAPITDEANLKERSGWKAVPRDLLTLEADPTKASSDPGYYGREYSFKGDVVVENHSLVAVFLAAQGRVQIYSRNGGENNLGRKIADLTPARTKGRQATISSYKVVRHAGDEVALEISFSGVSPVSAMFVFDKSEVVEIRPGQNLTGINLAGAFQYGVVPSFVGDDLVFNPKDYPEANTLCIPSENLFLGLIKGEASELVLTWSKRKQQVKLQITSGATGERMIESIDFENDGQSFYLAALSAPGIWHRETLSASQLEKDVPIKWKKPFPAKWKTQLYEEGTKTTFAFKQAKGQVWRGVPGSYTYPVWFNGDEAFFRLSKKVPPKGESVIYFVEPQETPLSISTPVDILKTTLGRAESASVLDMAGRQLRTHHRRGGDGVHRACTCGCTEAIQAVFEAGEEVTKKEHVKEDLEDMIFFVRRHIERIDEYQKFAAEMLRFLREKAAASPEVKPFVEKLEEIAKQIPEQYELQKENMKSLTHADKLAEETLALCSKKEPSNLKAYMDLLKAWRAMGGAQDYVVAQCHMITRRLFQEAGYGCTEQPKAVVLAEEIRTRCRQCLRNPDGYEIWADY